jgi:hypothetical protein
MPAKSLPSGCQPERRDGLAAKRRPMLTTAYVMVTVLKFPRFIPVGPNRDRVAE